MQRLVFCDIDGCLGPGKHIGYDLDGLALIRRLIARLATQGTGFCISTGRPQPYAEAMSQVLDVQTPFICENGGMVFTPQTDRATSIAPIADLKALDELRAALNPDEFIFEVGNEFSLCLSWDGILSDSDTVIATRRREMEQKYAHFGLNWTNSHTSIDVTPNGISKASGVSHILALFGLTPNDAFAIGDSHNDLTMLSLVGHGMCPANASSEVKALCKTIATSPRTQGVAELLTGLLV